MASPIVRRGNGNRNASETATNNTGIDVDKDADETDQPLRMPELPPTMTEPIRCCLEFVLSNQRTSASLWVFLQFCILCISFATLVVVSTLTAQTTLPPPTTSTTTTTTSSSSSFPNNYYIASLFPNQTDLDLLLDHEAYLRLRDDIVNTIRRTTRRFLRPYAKNDETGQLTQLLYDIARNLTAMTKSPDPKVAFATTSASATNEFGPSPEERG